jgi:hypothetical protein
MAETMIEDIFYDRRCLNRRKAMMRMLIHSSTILRHSKYRHRNFRDEDILCAELLVAMTNLMLTESTDSRKQHGLLLCQRALDELWFPDTGCILAGRPKSLPVMLAKILSSARYPISVRDIPKPGLNGPPHLACYISLWRYNKRRNQPEEFLIRQCHHLRFRTFILTFSGR